MKYKICLLWNVFFFFATCVYLCENLRVRLATQRKSPRKLNLHPFATTYDFVWPGLKTIMNYHTRGQTRKTIIDYHKEFEQAQTEW